MAAAFEDWNNQDEDTLPCADFDEWEGYYEQEEKGISYYQHKGQEKAKRTLFNL